MRRGEHVGERQPVTCAEGVPVGTEPQHHIQPPPVSRRVGKHADQFVDVATGDRGMRVADLLREGRGDDLFVDEAGVGVDAHSGEGQDQPGDDPDLVGPSVRQRQHRRRVPDRRAHREVVELSLIHI